MIVFYLDFETYFGFICSNVGNRLVASQFISLVLWLIFYLFCYNIQATFANVVSPLAELEAQQFPLVQSCIFPKLVSTSEEVRKASAEAEQRIDAHILMCRFPFFHSAVFLLLSSFFS